MQHDLITVGIPVLAILVASFWNNLGLKEVNTKLDRIDADLRQFYHLTGKLEGEIEGLKARMK